MDSELSCCCQTTSAVAHPEVTVYIHAYNNIINNNVFLTLL